MSNVFNETIVLKDDSTLDKEVEYLKSIGKSDQNKIKGSYGEKQVLYQLNKANEGMFVLRDINLEYKDMTAQIDFIVITSHHCYFVECKNYTGNIEINKNGEFVVNTKPGKRNGRVGIKSPLNQVEDQLEVFKKICLENEEKVKKLLEKVKFKDYFRTLVVFTNQENIIKASYAPKEVRSRVIKVDEIVRYIKRGSELHQGNRLNKEEMNAIGVFFLELNVEKIEPIVVEDLSVIEKSQEFKKKVKRNNSSLKDIILRFVSIILVILFLYLLSSAFEMMRKNNDVKNVELTENQTKAISIIKTAYNNSKNNGFEIIHYSVCKELSNMFNSPSFNCGGSPLEVNFINDNKMTIYKDNYCYTLELDKDGNNIIFANGKTKGFVENDWCVGKKIGYAEWDNENDYYKKIGGFNKLKEMAMFYYKNGRLSEDYFDYSKIQERGGNSQIWNTYKRNVEKFFGNLTGKGPLYGDISSKGFNEMVENYYYIMK